MTPLSFQFTSSPSLLGLSLEGGALTAAVVRMSGGRPRVLKTCRANLALDPLSADPELVGREIRTHLEEAGIRQSRCVVCVPLKWSLTIQTALPELSSEDRERFIRVEAERGFPFALQDLILGVSPYQFPGEEPHLTIAALPINRLATLEKVLHAARLRPVSIMFGISSLSGVMRGPGAITLLLSETSVELEIRAGNGVAAVRSLENAIESGAEGTQFDAGAIARQLRITLGNMPRSFGAGVASLGIFGPRDLCRALAEELRPEVQALGLSVDVPQVDEAAGVASGEIAPDLSPVAALAAAQRLVGRKPEFEFLPPHPTRLQRALSLFSRRGVMKMAVGAAVLIGLIVLVFVIQYMRLAQLESRWRAIEPKVTEVEELQQKIRSFRPWFDESVPSLSIAMRLTAAFPEDGAVWLTSFDVKGLSKVSCMGSARSDKDWRAMLEKLRNTPGIKNLQVLQVRGGSPLQFSLSYIDGTGEGDGI